MGVQVDAAGHDCVRLRAPLGPNINHEDTVFGGSASAVAILAAWSLVHVRMKAAGVRGRIVIRTNTMQYQKPIHGDFTATASNGSGDTASWTRLLAAISRKRMGRIAITSILECDGEQAGLLEGEFVVLPVSET